MRSFVRWPVLVAVQLMLGSIGANAGAAEVTETTPVTLPAVTVAADWLGAPSFGVAKKHPGARSVASEDGLTNIGARTLEGVLRQVPGVNVLDESGMRTKAGLAINSLSYRNYYSRGVGYSQGRMPQPGRAVLLSLQADL